MSKVFNYTFFLVFLVFLSAKIFAQTPDTSCIGTDIFCSANSMVGPWELHDTVVAPSFKICSSAGQSQNPLFFAFVPNSNTVSIDINPISITAHKGSLKKGYQYGIVDRCDFKDPNIEYLVCDGSPNILNTRTVTATNFIPGHTYYLIIDGFECAKVKFKLKVNSGIGGFVVDTVKSFVVSSYNNDTIKVGDTITACLGSEMMFEELGADNAEYFIWKTQDTLEMSDSFKLRYRFTKENTTYKICTTPMTDCDAADSSCLYVVIDTMETVVLDTAYICESALNTSHYRPEGWHGVAIDSAGTYYYNYADSIGCKVREQVTVVKVNEPVVEVDTVICDSDKFYKDTMIRDTIIDEYSCKTFMIKHIYYFSFKGFVTELSCDNDTFKISINQNGFDRSNYSNVLVNWYNEKNDVVKTSFSFDPFIVKKPGIYFPVVTLYQSGKQCSYTLNDTKIDFLPAAGFSLDKQVVCSNDTVYVELNNFIDTLSYKVHIDKGDLFDLGNGKYRITWNNDDAGSFELKVTVDFKNCSFEESQMITVQAQLSEPVIDCVSNTNNSVIIAWDSTGCVDHYEVWVDSKFYHVVNEAHDTIKGLTYGQKIGIEIKAISGCECENKSYQDSCSTINCPSRVVSIDNLPDDTCWDELEDSIKLTYIVDTTGDAIWIGDIVNDNGVIYKDKLSAGEHKISFKFKVDDCSYKIDTTITVFPQLSVDWRVKDISCFDSEDGILEINPSPELKDYALMLNQTEFNSLTIDSLAAGEYNFVLTDSNGCNFTAGFKLEQPSKPDIEIMGEGKIKFNTAYKYFVETDGIEPDSIYWYMGDSLLCAGDCDSVELKVLPTQVNFELCAIMYFDSLCEVEVCRDIKIDRIFDIYVPNIFTPNFDGINDFFTISSTNGLDIHIKSFSIFDRWGYIVYHKTDFMVNSPNSNLGWNGLINGEKALSGVYVYYIEVVSDDGEITKFSGDITLIR